MKKIAIASTITIPGYLDDKLKLWCLYFLSILPFSFTFLLFLSDFILTIISIIIQ